MCPKAIRQTLAATLIALALISMLPADFASAAQSSAQANRPKRGKNGQIVTGSGSQSAPARKTTSPTVELPRQESEPVAEGEDLPPAAQTQTRTKAPPPVSSSSQRTMDNTAQRPQPTQQRREPPPFDRPPLDAGQQSQQTSQPRVTQPPASPQTADSSTPTYRSSQGGRPRVEQRRDADPAPSNNDRGRATPPDLGGYDQQNRREKDKPVLRRRSDPPARAEQETDDPGPIASSKSESTPPVDESDEVRLDATLVNIPILVSDRSGRYIPQLSQNDFLLYEDGTQQEIAFFGDEQVPFNVALVLDVSPSVQGSLEEIQRAALEFVRQLRGGDRVMIVSFDKDIHYHTDFTSNRRELESAIRNTETGSGTSVYDAVYEVVSRKLSAIEGRKALILLSDGEDTTSSHASYDEAVNVVTESDVLVYGLRYDSGGGGNIRIDPWPRNRIPDLPIPLPWPWPFPRRRRGGTFADPNSMLMNAAPTVTAAAQGRGRRGRQGDFMEDLATAGGGPVYDADNISDLSRLAARVAEELRHVYQISYYPTNALTNGGYRSIRVRVRGRDDIAVRHRRGYNARDVATRPST
ncbi:MAG TPA: VWA domain-containing protein [Blastocatellia bacterium]|nr:VWA domain-containing protein [Blastocatellia bacterium]